MPERIFLWVDYDSTGLWYADGDRPAGTVDPDELPFSDATKKRLAAWVQRLDDLNRMKYIGSGPPPRATTWAAAEDEGVELWRALREEAGPEWAVGIRTAKGVAWGRSRLVVAPPFGPRARVTRSCFRPVVRAPIT